MDQLFMFTQNMRLLLGILMFAALSFLLTIAIWTAIKIWVFRQRVAKENGEERLRRFDAAGRRLPSSSPGVCLKCGTVQDAVYHLPHGRRLCRECYRTVGSS